MEPNKLEMKLIVKLVEKRPHRWNGFKGQWTILHENGRKENIGSRTVDGCVAKGWIEIKDMVLHVTKLVREVYGLAD